MARFRISRSSVVMLEILLGMLKMVTGDISVPLVQLLLIVVKLYMWCLLVSCLMILDLGMKGKARLDRHEPLVVRALVKPMFVVLMLSILRFGVGLGLGRAMRLRILGLLKWAIRTVCTFLSLY